MQAATVVAPQWASQFAKGDYHMVIAPWLLTVPGYSQYYAGAQRDSSVWVMMDNGAWEGCPLSSEDLLRCVLLLSPNEVVLPDVIGEAKDTLKASHTFLKELVKRTPSPSPQDEWDLDEEYERTRPSVMFVPQSAYAPTWWKCLDAWLDMWRREGWGDHFDLTIGINSPRIEVPERRVRVALLEEAVAKAGSVHLLGIPDPGVFFHHELPAARELGIRGVDSSLPFALGARRILLTADSKKWDMGQISLYEHVNYSLWPLIRLNILILRYWTDQGKYSPRIPMELAQSVASREREDRRVFTEPLYTLQTCRVPQGRYAIGYGGETGQTPLWFRPLWAKGEASSEEQEAVVSYSQVPLPAKGVAL